MSPPQESAPDLEHEGAELSRKLRAHTPLPLDSSVFVAGAQQAQVPPSPGSTGFGTSNRRQDQAARTLRANTGAGVYKIQRAQETAFPFLKLPGEIRNMIYAFTCGSPKQALLVHRPRLASLRSRTRQDRSRPLASEIEGHEQDKELQLTKPRRGFQPNSMSGGMARVSNRPFFGLTQVCRAIRYEYRPIYLRRQEIGMDLTDVVKYIQTFYADAGKQLAAIQAPGMRKKDLDFTGNLTIAVGDRLNAVERRSSGVDVFPLLDIWANSYKIEAGFGRYMKVGYSPEGDGEAKDLYRLFGRRVLANRQCSNMNAKWRTILRSRALAAVYVHRQPARPTTPIAGALPQIAQYPLAGDGAYLHLVFKKASAEPWMTAFESIIPATWLADRGFYYMEYFDIRVGVEQ